MDEGCEHPECPICQITHLVNKLLEQGIEPDEILEITKLALTFPLKKVSVH